MAKVFGLNGIVSGRIGSVVYAVRNGVQIGRRYNPIVMDSKSDAKTSARARFKLVSQLAATMSPVIAIPRIGGSSSRNLFFKRNYDLATFNIEDGAEIELTKVQLTDSSLSLPDVVATRQAGQATVLDVSLYAREVVGLNEVVYVAFERQSDNTLRYVNSVVVNTPGVSNTFNGSLPFVTSAETIVYAYGVRENTEKARQRFGQMQVLTAEMIANLIVTSSVSSVDVTLTETRATIVSANREVDREEKSVKSVKKS